jgi:hypothetical protein
MTAPPSLPSLRQTTLEHPEFRRPIKNTLFVQQFVNEQKSYASRYAKDGTRIFEQWKGNSGDQPVLIGDSVVPKIRMPGVDSAIAPSEQAFTLSSPPLIPRVPHHPQLDILEAARRLHTSKHDPLATDSPTLHNREQSRKERVQHKQKPDSFGPPHYLDEYEARQRFSFGV